MKFSRSGSFFERQLLWLVLGVLCVTLFSMAFNSASRGVRNNEKQKLETQKAAQPAVVVKKSESHTDTSLPSGLELDEETLRKRKDVTTLVEKAVTRIVKHKKKEVFEAITWSKEFKKGEIYLFVYGTDGTVWAHGDQPQLLWEDISEYKDDFGAYYIQGLVASAVKAGAAGGWFTYRWNRSTKTSYVRLVEKDGVQFVVGGGYYPHNKPDFVVSFVKGAVAFFNNALAQGLDKEAVFGAYNYPFGSFVFGDLYLYVLDEKGTVVAFGERPENVGINVWDGKDAQGSYFNREIIRALRDKPLGAGIWTEYVHYGDFKKAYSERISDVQGKSYYVISGYYPGGHQEVTLAQARQQVVDLVKKGVAFAKKHTTKEVSFAFSQATPYVGGQTIAYLSKNENVFVRGDLYLFAMKLDGTCIAYGLKPEDVGNNFWDGQDEDGRFLIREIIQKIQKEKSGWAEFKVKNAFWTVYAELATVDGKPIVIGCGFYPITKMNTMTLLVRSAVSYLKTHDEKGVFDKFTQRTGAFSRGDLAISVVDTNGFCYAHGARRASIWKNIKEEKDERGNFFVRDLIEHAQKGPSTLKAFENGSEKVYYAELVKKQNASYVVYSGYYP